MTLGRRMGLLPVAVIGGLAYGVRDCIADLVRFEKPRAAVLAVRTNFVEQSISWKLYEHSGPKGGSTESGILSSDMLPVSILSILLTLARDGLYDYILVTLPPGMQADLVALNLLQWSVRGQALADHLRISAVVAAVDTSCLETDLDCGDRMIERGLALGPEDSRTVAETTARNLEVADVVVVGGIGGLWMTRREP